MKIVSYLAVIFGVLMLMWVGFQMVLAQGKPEEIKKRANELLWVVVGIGVILGARILVTTIINTLQATGTVNPAIIQNAKTAINNQ
jgi:prolipoprotein diacylglyceryltransferase